MSVATDRGVRESGDLAVRARERRSRKTREIHAIGARVERVIFFSLFSPFELHTTGAKVCVWQFSYYRQREDGRWARWMCRHCLVF